MYFYFLSKREVKKGREEGLEASRGWTMYVYNALKTAPLRAITSQYLDFQFHGDTRHFALDYSVRYTETLASSKYVSGFCYVEMIQPTVLTLHWLSFQFSLLCHWILSNLFLTLTGYFGIFTVAFIYLAIPISSFTSFCYEYVLFNFSLRAFWWCNSQISACFFGQLHWEQRTPRLL